MGITLFCDVTLMFHDRRHLFIIYIYKAEHAYIKFHLGLKILISLIRIIAGRGMVDFVSARVEQRGVSTPKS